jgi:dienelactone hydrolase
LNAVALALILSLLDQASWEQKARPQILQGMQEVMGPIPDTAKRCDLDIQIQEQVDCGTYLRKFLTYQSEPGSRVPAYLLTPKEATNTFGVLCLHQTHAKGHKVVVGLGESPNDAYAVELVERGYTCLAPAYPLLANYAPDLKALGYQSGTMKAIWDNMRGLDLLESLPNVRKGRFAAIGHSLGGHNGVYTAAFDQRIKIVVSSCGLDSFRDYMDGNIRGWTSERYMPRLLNYSIEKLPFDFDGVISAIAPRTVFISAPRGDTNFKWDSVDRVAAAARPVFKMYGAEEKLTVEHPDAGHVFPKEVRARAYAKIDRALRGLTE